MRVFVNFPVSLPQFFFFLLLFLHFIPFHFYFLLLSLLVSFPLASTSTTFNTSLKENFFTHSHVSSARFAPLWHRDVRRWSALGRSKYHRWRVVAHIPVYSSIYIYMYYFCVLHSLYIYSEYTTRAFAQAVRQKLLRPSLLSFTPFRCYLKTNILFFFKRVVFSFICLTL